MKYYRTGAHTKYDVKVHLIWATKYRKCVLCGEVAVRVRDLIRRISMEHEIDIISGKVARDHIHLFVSYRAVMSIAKMVQELKGASSRILLKEFSHLRKQFWGKHLWARGYCAISSGTITDEMIAEYINEQEGEPMDDSRFQIDTY